MIKTIPAGRMQLSQLAPRPYAAMIKLEASIELAQHLRELVKLRASQMNGCAFCIDMHWKDARAAGASEARLYGLDAWREVVGAEGLEPTVTVVEGGSGAG